MSLFKDKRILVTGGNGFLGTYVVKALLKHGCSQVTTFKSSVYDLRNSKDIERLFDLEQPHIIIHLAASVGGIEANRQQPGKFFYDNAVMGIQLMEQAREFGVEKFVTVGTVCSYPKHTPVPFKEEDVWNGYPEETNAPYGLAKKMLLVQGQAYRQEYGFNAIFLVLANLYGGGDNFDLETSHVIPALIRKCSEAGDGRVTCWGDGSPTRDFLYVEDAAEAIVLATEKYNKPEPVNIGTGQEVSIKNLAIWIGGWLEIDNIEWDLTKPNGQPRRCLDVSRAKHEFGFEAKTSLNNGLKKTIDWYLEQ